MFNLLEFAMWGKKSRTYKHLVSGKRAHKQQSRLVLNDRAWLRLSGKLFSELPRDEAISVLNTIKQYAK
jgi:hypothetical protein